MSNVLKKDQLLLIPNILADTTDIIKPLIKYVDHPLLNKCDTLIIHNVKKKETLYSISKKYNLSIDKIISNNLFLEDEGLLKDQNLRIKLRIKDCLDDSLLQTIDSLSIIDSINFQPKKLRVSIVLPFFIDKSDSIIINCSKNTDCSIDKMTENSLQISEYKNKKNKKYIFKGFKRNNLFENQTKKFFLKIKSKNLNNKSLHESYEIIKIINEIKKKNSK